MYVIQAFICACKIHAQTQKYIVCVKVDMYNLHGKEYTKYKTVYYIPLSSLTLPTPMPQHHFTVSFFFSTACTKRKREISSITSCQLLVSFVDRFFFNVEPPEIIFHHIFLFSFLSFHPQIPST